MVMPANNYLKRLLRKQLLAVLALSALHSHVSWADQQVVTGNAGSLTANARLTFNIAIGKYVLLRVGNADATQSDVTFTIAPSPAIGNGNSLPYTGGIPVTLNTSVVTVNPASSAGVLSVSAFSNVTGTALTCATTPLGTNVAFATGATLAGIPGRFDIKVASAAGGVQHPGADLSACSGAVSSAIPALTLLNGSFTYSTTFAPGSLAAGTYGNVITYTATAP
jgi:hypothetical protein